MDQATLDLTKSKSIYDHKKKSIVPQMAQILDPVQPVELQKHLTNEQEFLSNRNKKT